MLKLIKLEIKKNKLKGYTKGVVIANLIILILIYFTGYASKNEIEPVMNNWTMFFLAVDTLVRSTFVIFTSVVMSKLIIDEYKNKTISVMFMYPISRKKLIIAKLIIVVLFGFFTMLISNIFIISCFYFGNGINLIQDKLTIDILMTDGIRNLINIFSAAFMSLIPLYFGMRKKSVPATITSAVILVSIICSNGNGFRLSSIILVQLLFAAIGIFIGYLSIRNVDNIDLTN